MKRKILRILSVLLVCFLLISAVPTGKVNAVATTVDEVKQQIRDTYRKARAFYGWDTFKGFCGALTNVQLHLLGITKEVIGADGRDAYDAFKYQTVTSGGYSVKLYPARTHTLKSALNEITKHGTQDAYNILVGFEKSPTVLGRRFGHSLMIQAIIDGTVYYMESYDVYMRGSYHAEGTPLTATIDEFDAYYAMTTTQFDGVVHFGLKTYADSCTRYSSNALGTANAGAMLWSQPCEDAVSTNSAFRQELAAGEQLNITGLYLNTEGEYWYEINEGKTGYIRTGEVSISQLRYDDITLTGSLAPSVLTQGKGFSVKGNIQSEHNSIYSIRARVYRPEADQLVQVINTTDAVNGKAYNLLRSPISNGLTFRNLEVGQYRYELAAIVSNHYVEADQLMTDWDTVILWTSDFAVLDQKATVYTVSFDGCGGVADLNQTVVLAEQPVGALSVPQRPGYIFLGWFTEAEGGEQVRGDYVPTADMTLYAHWISQEQLRTEWMENGNCWYLYSDGISTMICIELDGTLYHFSSLEPMCQSWMVWTNAGAA